VSLHHSRLAIDFTNRTSLLEIAEIFYFVSDSPPSENSHILIQVVLMNFINCLSFTGIYNNLSRLYSTFL
jgi:hypothetical protein